MMDRSLPVRGSMNSMQRVALLDAALASSAPYKYMVSVAQSFEHLGRDEDAGVANRIATALGEDARWLVEEWRARWLNEAEWFVK